MNPYEKCPILENENFLLRFVEADDAKDLLLVYSDEKAWPIFNSDNCVDDFCYTTLEQMQKTIDFWQREYKKKYYVRWAIIDKNINNAIGTIELFNRKAEDYFDDCGLLRLDLHSDYECVDSIKEIMLLILSDAFEMFKCRMIATKVPPIAVRRKLAMEQLGFAFVDRKLIGGHDNKEYGDYYILEEKNAFRECPVYETNGFDFRLVELKDADNLFECYSDQITLKHTNGDNCNGKFRCQSVDDMKRIIMSWQKEYIAGNYIRWSIIKKESAKVVGTMEIAPIPYAIKFYKGCDTGILRIDLISDEETVENYVEILAVVKKEFFKDFLIKKIAFKAPQSHYNKVKAMEKMCFQEDKESELPFEDYYILLER